MDGNFGDGGCACGAVRFRVQGDPRRVGICHCLDCRKAHGSVFNAFAIFTTAQVEMRGELRDWHGSPGYNRRYCSACGSRVCGTGDGDEIELALGSFDAPGRYTPQYESWVGRREHWLTPLPVPQNPGNLPDE
jgi:hypothetical protein